VNRTKIIEIIMEIRNIETFVTAVENGSFSAAAGVLGYTQSTVTVHVKQLEDEFGVLLFERIGKKVHLTEEGRRFYSYALDILKEVREAAEAMQPDSEPEGLLRLGSVNSLSQLQLPGLLLELHRKYPKITVAVESEAPPMLFEMLRHNELDLLYLLGGGPLPDDMISVYEHKEPLHFVVSQDHPLARKKKVTLPDLSKCEFVTTQKTAATLKRDFAAAGFDFEPFITAGTTDLLLQMASESDAVTFLLDFASQHYVDIGKVRRLNVPEVDEHYVTKMIYHRNKWVSPQMQAFISLL
jgi:DNA-binding transcriptional LysR family regulator